MLGAGGATLRKEGAAVRVQCCDSLQNLIANKYSQVTILPICGTFDTLVQSCLLTFFQPYRSQASFSSASFGDWPLFSQQLRPSCYMAVGSVPGQSPFLERKALPSIIF